MTAIVSGVHKQGTIELLEAVPGLPDGPVRVLVLTVGQAQPGPRLLTFGMYPGDASTLDDFADAQWHGDAWDEADAR